MTKDNQSNAWNESSKVYLSDIVGSSFDDNFLDFDITEIQQVLVTLKQDEAIDITHAELLQQKSLRGADLVAEYLSKMTKIVSYLENKISSIKNKASLDYVSAQGRTTADAKKWAGESSPELETWHEKLAKAKGSKVLLEKKFEILIKSHHHYKDIAAGLRKTIVGNSLTTNSSNDTW